MKSRLNNSHYNKGIRPKMKTAAAAAAAGTAVCAQKAR